MNGPSDIHGKYLSSHHNININLIENKYINKILIHFNDSFIYSLTFYTNLENTFRPYGSTTNGTEHIILFKPGYKLCGIFGHTDEIFINAIDFYSMPFTAFESLINSNVYFILWSLKSIPSTIISIFPIE